MGRCGGSWRTLTRGHLHEMHTSPEAASSSSPWTGKKATATASVSAPSMRKNGNLARGRNRQHLEIAVVGMLRSCPGAGSSAGLCSDRQPPQKTPTKSKTAAATAAPASQGQRARRGTGRSASMRRIPCQADSLGSAGGGENSFPSSAQSWLASGQVSSQASMRAAIRPGPPPSTHRRNRRPTVCGSGCQSDCDIAFIAVSPPVQARRVALAGVIKPTHHRADGDIQGVGDLTITQFAFGMQDEGLPLGGRKLSIASWSLRRRSCRSISAAGSGCDEGFALLAELRPRAVHAERFARLRCRPKSRAALLTTADTMS